MTGDTDSAIDLFTAHLPHFHDALFADQDSRLTIADGEIAFDTMMSLEDQGIAALPIYDSFIV